MHPRTEATRMNQAQDRIKESIKRLYGLVEAGKGPNFQHRQHPRRHRELFYWEMLAENLSYLVSQTRKAADFEKVTKERLLEVPKVGPKTADRILELLKEGN